VRLRTVIACALAAALLPACGEGSPEPAVDPPAPSASTTIHPGLTVTVTGTVVLAGTCPVRVPPQPCPAQPVAATIEVRDTLGGTARNDGPLVATTRAGDDGRYSVDIAPGGYVVSARTAVPSSCSSVPITVERTPLTADLTCAPLGG
jgi:hypothetical protein